MTEHELVHILAPFWRALTDIEKMSYDIYRDGNYNRAMDVACICRDTKARFTVKEKELAEALSKTEVQNGMAN